MKAKAWFAASAGLAWLGFVTWALPLLAGALFMLSNKNNPSNTTRGMWYSAWLGAGHIPLQRKRLQGSMAISGLLLLGIPLVAIAAATSRKRSLHGDARWATVGEMREAGLLNDKGIILGKRGAQYLMMNDPKFVLLCAPTRSGKGVGTIIPNLLNWSDSCIVVDIKGENAAITSGYRAECGQAVYVFSPFDESFRSHRWNPLSYVNTDPVKVVGELQSIGYMLYPREEGANAFFDDQARNAFLGICLYCLETGLPFTIGEVLRRSSGGGRPHQFWREVIDQANTPDGKVLSERCLNALRQFVGTSDNTFTSILSSFNAPLGVFANPMVDAATSGNDFDLRQVRRQRMTIYVDVPANRLAEASLLVNLFFSIAIDQNTTVLPEKDQSLRFKCLLVLDEFPALGRIDKYVKSIGYIAGFGLRCITIAQSLSQLQERKLYGVEGTRTLTANHGVNILYAPREQADCKEYSDILGTATEQSLSRGRSRSNGRLSTSTNTGEAKRPLMYPQELRQMGEREIIVLADNCLPAQADKIFYYEDPMFKGRLRSPILAPVLDVQSHLATTEKQLAQKSGKSELTARLPKKLDAANMPKLSEGDTVVTGEIEELSKWFFQQVVWSSPIQPVSNG